MFTQKQLDVFRAVMATGSVSEAGRRLNLSQPSISRIVGDLERQFGMPLFQRKSKGVQPTAEATAFLREVEHNRMILANLEEAALQIAQKERGALSVATITAGSLEVVPRALARMNISDNPLTLNMQVKPSRWVLDFALSGQMFTGFANVLHVPTGVNVLYESSLPHLCFSPPGTAPCPASGPVRLEELSACRIIGLQGEVADELRIRRIGRNARAPLTAETSLSALTLARHTGALPIIDGFTACHWLRHSPGTLLAIEDLPRYQFAVFEPTGARAAEVDRAFQSRLIAEIQVIEAELAGHLAGPGV
jgi:DNA-binding transcriptional LysR family regulator